MSKREFILNEDGAICYVVRGWLEKKAADALFDKYVKELKFEQYQVRIYNKMIDQPRLNYAFGDDDLKTHKYSGTEITIHPWQKDAKELAVRAMVDTDDSSEGQPQTNVVNSCLLNYYPDGKSYIGYHSDKETHKEFNNTVITVSLGATRRFYFQRKSDKKVVKTELHNGDLVIMKGRTQELFKHTIPKQAKVGPRISLTYRYLTSDRVSLAQKR